ncbi:MAG: flagellar hook-basal body complex protein [Oceanospirillaceae bacterium]|nr:flagellar hook-basal body complex protein [Oceanospirillaceae bacterium]
MSFYTSLTGLNAAQAQLGITSNNVSNVGTVGFKKSRAEFGDIFATSPLENASSAIGQGVLLKKVNQQFSQGNIEFSSNSLDLAISGQGFFALKPSQTSNQTVYTRAGSFSVNNDRYVVDSSGQYLQTFPVNDDGSVIATGLSSAKSLQLPSTAGLPQPSSQIELGLNLPAGASILPKSAAYTVDNPYSFDRNDSDTFNKSTSITVYDSLGNPHIATVYYVKTSSATEADPTNKWDTKIFIGDKELDPSIISAKNDKSETMYMNKFGQISTNPAATDPTFNAAAAHPLYFNDDQNTTVPSEPATFSGGYMTRATVGHDFGSTDSNEVSIVAPVREVDTFSFDADVSTGGGISFSDGTSTYAQDFITSHTATLDALVTKINVGQSDFMAERAGSTMTLTAFNATALPTMTVTATTDGATAINATKTDTYASSGWSTEGGGTFDGTNFVSVSVDGSDPQTIDIAAGSYTGTELAAEMTRQLNSKFGDERSYKMPTAAEDRTVTIELQDRSGNDINKGMGVGGLTNDLTIVVDQYQEGTTDFTREQLVANVQAKVDAVTYTGTDSVAVTGLPITVGYDLTTRALTFTPTNATYGSVKASSPTGVVAFGLDSATAAFSDVGEVFNGGQIVPTGDLNLDAKQQRMGLVVTYGKDSHKFSFRSGTTGEASTISVTIPSGTASFGGASHLLGIGATYDTEVANTTGTGLASTAGAVTGSKAGVDITGTFSVTSNDNTISVTIDGVDGTVVIPPAAYTGHTFAQAIQDRINLIQHIDGRQVNDVEVKFEQAGQFFSVTSGTVGANSSVNINGHSNWGFDTTSQIRGTVPAVTVVTQAKDREGNLLYIDQSGKQTTQKPDTTPAWTPIYLDKGELTFDTYGKLISPKEGVKYSPFDPSNGSDLLTLGVDYGKFSTQYSAPFSVLSLSQDGYPSGQLDGLDIDSGGVVRANYTNGTQVALGKLMMANFANPNGLKQVGNANFVSTTNSGAADLGEAGSDGFGDIQGGALERANVDLTEELVNLITAQRNFQANAKAIETSSSLTQTIINIRG